MMPAALDTRKEHNQFKVTQTAEMLACGHKPILWNRHCTIRKSLQVAELNRKGTPVSMHTLILIPLAVGHVYVRSGRLLTQPGPDRLCPIYRGTCYPAEAVLLATLIQPSSRNTASR